MARSKRIGIVHYRVGRTDGVSLEIEKRKAILEDLGCEVKLISGPIQTAADFVIDMLEFDAPQVREIKENSFAFFGKKSLGAGDLMQRIGEISDKIQDALLGYAQATALDALLVHNVFSHGRHIAAASAIARVAQRLGLPVLSTNHDYYWERPEYQESTFPEVAAYLREFVPPRPPNILHVSINSLAAARLKAERGIDSLVFPDIFDFCQPVWRVDGFNCDFLKRFGIHENDLVILQATRIVPRKGIELAVDFVAELNKRKRDLVGKTLYNGKVFGEENQIVLLLAGYAEQSAQPYLRLLKERIRQKCVSAKFICEAIGASRSAGPPKTYALWDAYVFADLVTYPSLFEGWGNQFIEAVFARKPVVLFEYPVFLADIKKEGYAYISLGHEIENVATPLASLPESRLTRAVEETLRWLCSTETERRLAQNFAIGRRYHDFEVLKRFLQKQLLDSRNFS